MRLLVPCMKCFEEFGEPSRESSRVEFCDNGRYEIICSHGHETVTLLQQQKFELLFDIGAHAILDGYYREAISSFSSSLERFFEFSIRVFLESINKTDELFQQCWKTVKNQSERQLGAFTFLWAYCMKHAPDLLPNNKVNFRNDVIHKGKIPTKNEAIQYGNSIMNIILPKIALLKKKYPEEIRKVVFYHLRDKSRPEDQIKTVSTICINTIISLSRSEKDENLNRFEDSLKGLSQRIKRLTIDSV